MKPIGIRRTAGLRHRPEADSQILVQYPFAGTFECLQRAPDVIQTYSQLYQDEVGAGDEPAL
jgi:hypothetical protein